MNAHRAKTYQSDNKHRLGQFGSVIRERHGNITDNIIYFVNKLIYASHKMTLMCRKCL